MEDEQWEAQEAHAAKEFEKWEATFPARLKAAQDEMKAAIIDCDAIESAKHLFTKDYIENASLRWLKADVNLDSYLTEYYLKNPSACDEYICSRTNNYSHPDLLDLCDFCEDMSQDECSGRIGLDRYLDYVFEFMDENPK
jgi:hypothetical protein